MVASGIPIAFSDILTRQIVTHDGTGVYHSLFLLYVSMDSEPQVLYANEDLTAPTIFITFPSGNFVRYEGFCT